MRTGATNIADFLTEQPDWSVDRAVLSALLAMTLAAQAFSARGGGGVTGGKALSDINNAYWLAMLTAGVLGTVFGDLATHQFGGGAASLALLAAITCRLPMVTGWRWRRRAAPAQAWATGWRTTKASTSA